MCKQSVGSVNCSYSNTIPHPHPLPKTSQVNFKAKENGGSLVQTFISIVGEERHNLNFLIFSNREIFQFSHREEKLQEDQHLGNLKPGS